VSRHTDSEKLASPGLAAFDSLRAEDEPWLEHCFVPPPEFDLIAGARSVLVLGEAGSGKTALYQALWRRLAPGFSVRASAEAHPKPAQPNGSARPARLCFEWRPLPGVPPAMELRRLLAAGAEKLLSYLAHWPAQWDAAPDYARNTLAWFLHTYLTAALPRLAEEMDATAEVVGQTLLRDLTALTAQNPYLDEASPDQIIAEVTKALSQVGLTDMCVLVGPDDLGDLSAAGKGLNSFLSTLRLFENPRLVYKFVLPAEIIPHLSEAGGLLRCRLDRYALRWLDPHLLAVVERRLWLATGRQVERLEQICEDRGVIAWLARCGGAFPRGWLSQARPLATHYLSLDRALTAKEWQAIRRLHPPELWLDQENRQVIVGQRRIHDLPEVEWAILSYLYQHRDRICTRDELYHNALLPLSQRGEKGQRFFAKEYEGALNNALLRLRQAIEPDPAAPLFIITYKKRGVKLEHAW